MAQVTTPMDGLFSRCCQTDSNQSQYGPKCRNLFPTNLTPLGESGVTVKLEIVSAVERALLIEMVSDGGMNDDEFLQTLHVVEPLHRSLPSSKRKVEILSPIVQLAASFLLVGIAVFLHPRTVGSQLFGHQYMTAAAPIHLFIFNFNGVLQSRRFVTKLSWTSPS